MIGYIHYEAPVEEQNFSTLIEFINAMEVREMCIRDRETAAARPPERKGRDAMSVTEIENYRELILENIEYDCLKQRYPLYLDDLNEIVELLSLIHIFAGSKARGSAAHRRRAAARPPAAAGR